MNKNSWVYNVGRKIYKKTVWIMAGISPQKATKMIYYRVFHQKLDLKNPKTLNEKIQYLKLGEYYRNPLITQCADKYAVRKYVEEKGLSSILNEMLMVVNDPDEIDFAKLPDKFVIKCNHSSGGNIICTEKESFDAVDARRKLWRYYKEDYWREYAETNYRFITKKIIIEKYIETVSGNLPTDYRMMCFHGEPKFLYLTTWGINEILQRQYLDIDWKVLDIGDSKEMEIPPKPDNFDEMLEIARILSADFKFVRVDLFSVEGKIYFGELTFTPTGGYTKDFDNSYVNDLLSVL